MLLSTRLLPAIATNIISLGDVSILTKAYAAHAVGTNDWLPDEQGGGGCAYKPRCEPRERSPHRGGIVGAYPGEPGKQEEGENMRRMMTMLAVAALLVALSAGAALAATFVGTSGNDQIEGT